MATQHLRQLSEGNSAGQVLPSELNFFEAPPLSAAFLREEFVDYRPSTANLNSGGSIDFLIPPSLTQYVSLSRTRVHVKLRITRGDGSAFNPAEEAHIVTPINWLGATMFETVQLYLNQTLVSASGGQHSPYKAILEALLDKGCFEKNTSLQAGLFKKDTAGRMETYDYPDGGAAYRWQWTAASQSFDLCAPIICDLAQQGRLIISGVEMLFKLWLARPEFVLMTDDDDADYKLDVQECFLRVCKKMPQPAVTMGVATSLELSPILYPFNRTEVRQLLLNAGTYGFSFENLFDGLIPSVMTVAIVSGKSASGTYDTNPFFFQHKFISSLNVMVDDQSSSDHMMKFSFHELGFLRSSYLDGFNSLFKPWTELPERLWDPAASCDITREEYARGYTLFNFRFTSTANSRFLPFIVQGNLRITGRFSKALDENCNLVVYARFPSMLTIDKSRRIEL